MERRRKRSWQPGRQDRPGHSPALTWLFLTGLRPRSARLRFTKHRDCRKDEVGGEPITENNGGHKGEKNGCIGPPRP
jgi:hypothetical protein